MIAARPHLAALTSLRFAAALLIFFFHVEAAGLLDATDAVKRVAAVGYVGVNWFFVLSGFILAYSYADRPFCYRNYGRARVARIYPAYVISLCVALPMFAYVVFFTPLPSEQLWLAPMRDHFFTYALLCVVLMQAWVPMAALSVNPVGWSLSVEVFFYLVFPFSLARLARRSKRALLLTLFFFNLLSVAVAYVYVFVSPDGVTKTTYDMNHFAWLNALRFNPLVRLPEFLIGVCGALLYRGSAVSIRWATPLTFGGLILLALTIAYADCVPYPVLHNGLLSLPFLAVIYGIALGPSWSVFLEWRGLRVLGEASFSFFLTHGFVIVLYIHLSREMQRAYSNLGVIACLVIAQTLAFALYRWIEQPMRRRLSEKSAPPLLSA